MNMTGNRPRTTLLEQAPASRSRPSGLTDPRSQEASIQSLISFQHTVQNGSLLKLARAALRRLHDLCELDPLLLDYNYGDEFY
jgi:hypothetical protein